MYTLVHTSMHIVRLTMVSCIWAYHKAAQFQEVVLPGYIILEFVYHARSWSFWYQQYLRLWACKLQICHEHTPSHMYAGVPGFYSCMRASAQFVCLSHIGVPPVFVLLPKVHHTIKCISPIWAGCDKLKDCWHVCPEGVSTSLSCINIQRHAWIVPLRVSHGYMCTCN